MIYKPDHPNAQQSGCVFEHILVAERALGHVLPRGAIVHHVNENPLDNRPSNLAILPSRGYHMALHARLRVLKAGGHPHRDQICSRCKGIKPKTEFPAIPRDRERSSVWCRACNREHYRQRRDAASA